MIFLLFRPCLIGKSFLVKEVFTSYGRNNRYFFMKGGSVAFNNEGSAFRWFAPSRGNADPDEEPEEYRCEKLIFQHEKVEEGGWRRIELPLCLRQGCGCHLCYPRSLYRAAFRIAPDDDSFVEMVLNEESFGELPNDSGDWWKPWEHGIAGKFVCYRLQRE